jgi:ribose transport system permease protein
MPDLHTLRSKYYLTALCLTSLLLVSNLAVDSQFLAPSNLPATFAALAPFALAAIASTPAVLSGGGGIDISIAPLMSTVNIFLVTVLMPGPSLVSSPLMACVLSVALGAAVGAINGLLVTRLRYQPILATLCAVFVLTGLSLKMAPTPQSAEDHWTDRLTSSVLGIPAGLLVIALPLVCWALLSRTRWMSNLYAIGGDEAAAYSAGVPVASVRLLAYTFGGAVAGLGGIAFTALLRSGDATIASQYILFALTAVAIGGTSLAGGRGGVIGSLLGATTIFLIQNYLTALGLPSMWLNVVYGTALLVAIVLSGGLPALRRRAVVA